MTGEDTPNGAASAADMDVASSSQQQEQPPPPPTLDLPLHSTIRALQLQNGLRHGDYQRYRHYTTRRLRRLRKAVKTTHQGKGRTFQAKPVTHEVIATPENLKMEHLLLSLLNAERAWSFAMQLKQDAGAAVAGHTRSHMLRRLRKASMWAKRLHEIVTHHSVRLTERTALEVEAYAGWMASSLDIEKERWREGLGKLKTAHSILSQLGEVGSLEDQDLFSNRAEEIMQSMRYCQYNLGEGSSEALLDDLRNHNDQVPQALRDKMEAVLTTSRKAQASSLDHINWDGVRNIPINSEDIRVAVLKVKEAVKALEAVEGEEEDGGIQSARDAQCTQVYAAYEEALRGVQAEAHRVSGMSSGAKVEAQKEELKMLASYLQHGKLEWMMNRNQTLITRLLAAAENQRSKADLVHVYDALVQNAADILKLPGVEDLEEILTKTQALQARFRAHRAFYLAEYHASSKPTPSLPEALVLYELAGNLATQALELIEDLQESEDKQAAIQDLEKLYSSAAGKHQCIVRSLSLYLPFPPLDPNFFSFILIGGRYRTQALALLTSLAPEGGGGGASTASAGSKSEQEAKALTAAMAALSLDSSATSTAVSAAAATKKKGASGSSKRGSQATSKRILLERLEDLDGGAEGDGFGLASIPPRLESVPCKPSFFDIAFNYLEQRVPDLAAKAGISKPTKAHGRQGSGGGGGGLFGWLTG